MNFKPDKPIPFRPEMGKMTPLFPLNLAQVEGEGREDSALAFIDAGAEPILFARAKALEKRKAPSDLQYDPSIMRNWDILEDMTMDERRNFIRLNKELIHLNRNMTQMGLEPIVTPKDFTHHSLFWRTLEFIRRPQYVLNSIIYDLQEWDFTDMDKKIWAALRGKYKVDGSDIMKNVFEPMGLKSNSANLVAGLVFDLVYDPINWVSLFGPTTFGKGATALAKAGALSKSGKVILSSEAYLNKLKTAVNWLGDPAGMETLGRLASREGLQWSAGAELPFEILKKGEAAGLFKELPSLAKFELPAKIGGGITPESKMFKLIMEKTNNLEDAAKVMGLIKGDDMLEMISRGQWGFITIFGKSLLPRWKIGDKTAEYFLGEQLLKGIGRVKKQPIISNMMTNLEGMASSTPWLAGKVGEERKIGEEVYNVFYSMGLAGKYLTYKLLTPLNDISKNIEKLIRKTDTWKNAKTLAEKQAIEKEWMTRAINYLEVPLIGNRAIFLVNALKDSASREGRQIRKLIAKEYGLSLVSPEDAQQLARFLEKGKIAKGSEDFLIYNRIVDKLVDRVLSNWEEFKPILEKVKSKGGLSAWTRLESRYDLKYNLDMLKAFFGEAGIGEWQKIERHYAKMLELAQKSGLAVNRLEGYSARVASPKAKAFLDEYMPQYDLAMPRQLRKVFKAAKRRIGLYSFEEIQAYATEHLVGGAGLTPIFVDNPILAAAMYSKSVARAVPFYDAIWEAASRFGKPGAQVTKEMIEQGWRKVDGIQDVLENLHRAGRLPSADWYFHPFAAGSIDAMASTIKANNWGPIQNVLRTVTQFWKKWTLGVRPAFHMRNIVSNVWNNWLAGVGNPEDYVGAAALQLAMKKEFDAGRYLASEFVGEIWDKPLLKVGGAEYKLFSKMTGRTYTLREMADAVQKFGIQTSGWFGAELPEMAAEMMGPRFLLHSASALGYIGDRINGIARLGFQTGRMFEDNARITHFMHKVLKEGMTFDDASKSVAKYLFDYSDVSKLVGEMRQTWFPFITWYRKNIPLQLESIIKETWRYDKIDTFREYMERGEPLDYDEVSKYVAESVPIRIRVNKETGNTEFFTLENWISATDLQKIFGVKQMMNTGIELVNPLIKMPIEVTKNWSLFFEAPIEKYPGQRARFIGDWTLPAKTVTALKTLGIIGEISRLTDPELALWQRGARLVGLKFIQQKAAGERMSKLYEYRDAIRGQMKFEQKKREKFLLREAQEQKLNFGGD